MLNYNWHGASGASQKDFEAPLLRNLTRLIDRIRTDLKLVPRIVFSSTWRLQPHLIGRFYRALDGVGVRAELIYSNDPSTPDLGMTPEGRAAEISSWLQRNGTTTTNPRPFIVLDDLDLLFRNAMAVSRDAFFVRTVSYETEQATGWIRPRIGLTAGRVGIALELVRRQVQDMQRGCPRGNILYHIFMEKSKQRQRPTRTPNRQVKQVQHSYAGAMVSGTLSALRNVVG